jgi:hypothetical protein
MLITHDYLKLNSEMHSSHAGYGSAGWQWIGPIIYFMRSAGAKTVLDYGAGKATLAAWMPSEYPVTNYDPVTFPDEPAPQDFLVCLDVLEHIEPDCLDDVLRHMRSKTKRAGLLVISTREANKTLKDGRNAHLIVQPKEFWIPRVQQFFRKVQQIKGIGSATELTLVVGV